MKTKICQCCKKEFVPSSPNQKFCKKCLNTYNRHQLDRASKGMSPIITAVCPICGKTFQKKGTDKYCKECKTTHTRYFLENFTQEQKEATAQKKREQLIKNYVHHKLMQCKKRAEKRGIEFNLEESDIIIPDKCPILEVPLIIGTKGDYAYSPSIDRIDNSKGYIKENVQIISNKANSMKNSASPKELLAFIKNIKRYSLILNEQEIQESKDKEP